MKLPVILMVTALMSLAGSSRLSAQTVSQPGQLGASLQARYGADVEQYSSPMPKTTVANVSPDRHDRLMNRLWVVSMVSALAGTSLDAVSSWGQREGNAFLASSDGRFEAKGVVIKGAFAAALVVPQICLRRHKDLKGPFAAGNFTEAGIFAAVSAHNFQLRSAGN